jgi:hypothetical protein
MHCRNEAMVAGVFFLSFDSMLEKPDLWLFRKARRAFSQQLVVPIFFQRL